MHALTDILPPKARQVIYAVYAVAGVVLGTLAVVFVPPPAALVTATAVYAYLGTVINSVAASNVDTDVPESTEEFGD